MILLYMVKIKYEVFFQVTTVLMKYKEEQKLPSPNISMEFFLAFHLSVPETVPLF